MGRKTITLMTCDICGTEENVAEHTIIVDKTTSTIDACTADWEKQVAPVTELMALGRVRKRPGRPPGSSANGTVQQATSKTAPKGHTKRTAKKTGTAKKAGAVKKAASKRSAKKTAASEAATEQSAGS